MGWCWHHRYTGSSAASKTGQHPVFRRPPDLRMRDMAEGNIGPAPEAGANGRVRAAVLGLVLLYGVMAVVALAVHLAVQGPAPTAFAPVFFAVYPAMGTLIVLRRGSHRIGWMLSAVGSVLWLHTTPDHYAIYALALDPPSLPCRWAPRALSQTLAIRRRLV